jgi:hypothetical protein
LVDFRQVQLDSFGPFIRVLADADSSYVFSTTARGLPVDAKRHVITVVEYQGDGLYSSVPPGQFAPWTALPASLANAFYGAPN